ncbi:hypothetical protein C8J57DRAFT_208934 [Mycena rebaudengoi]|nr:hypothetical protein C8J57DRAFT_208934 [Mycena rebaudengoi]
MFSAPALDTVTCRLCRRQFSKYTCPTCNVPYCSLTCFRSEAHSQCSETFYKKEVESDIRAEPSKTAQERQQMLALLKRFEEDSTALGDAQSLADENEEDDSDLAHRFQNVDLESTSPDHLWTLLTPAEREKFLKVMEDPSSDLALQLLASEELEIDKQEPWWEAPSVVDDDDAGPSSKRYGVPPEEIHVLPSLRPSKPGSPSLIYNICAVCIAYSYTTRHLSFSPLSTASAPDANTARALLSTLMPFLTTLASKTLHPTFDSAITDIHSRLPPDLATPRLFALLLRDAASLLRPALVISEDDAQTGAYTRALRMLGDLHGLFRSRAHVAHKIMFYAAFVAAGGSREAVLELEREAQSREADLVPVENKVAWERLDGGKQKARIVEVGSGEA